MDQRHFDDPTLAHVRPDAAAVALEVVGLPGLFEPLPGVHQPAAQVLVLVCGLGPNGDGSSGHGRAPEDVQDVDA